MGRSYTEDDINQLMLGDGNSMTGDMGMFFLKACLESGISFAAGYPGAPTSNVMDLLADSNDMILRKSGIYFESSTNEAAAATKLYLSINEKIRGFVNWKVVGTNVASDVLAHISSSGVKGGSVVLIGEDEECISTTVQMKSLIYASGFLLPIIDPIASPKSIHYLTKKAFELSEYCNQPVMLLFRSLSSNMIGTAPVSNNQIPKISNLNKSPEFLPESSRVPIPPDTLVHAKEKYHERLPKAIEYIRKNKLNVSKSGYHSQNIGIITQGGLFNSLMTVLSDLKLGNLFGDVAVDLLTLNVLFPLDPEEIKAFLIGKDKILIVEQGEPNIIEREIKTIAFDSKLDIEIYGKNRESGEGYIPLTEALNYDVLLSPVAAFFLEQTSLPQISYIRGFLDEREEINEKIASDIMTNWIPRSPSFCTGCPERPVFSALKRTEEEMNTRFIRLIDIGCYTMAKLSPFNMSDSCTGMGSALDVGMGMANLYDKPIIVVLGDGTLFHSGLRNIDNAIHNNLNQIYQSNNLDKKKANVLVFLLLNYHTAMTGDQANPMTLNEPRNSTQGVNMRGEVVERVNLTNLFKTHGARWVKTIPSYDILKMKKTISDALKVPGLKIIISDGECMLEKQRTIRKENSKRLKMGKQVEIPKVQVDPRLCSGCWPCSEYVGCPSEGKIPSPNPLKEGFIREMLPTCVGCGVCSEVTQKFGLCPSTYNYKIIKNPSLWTKFSYQSQKMIINALRKI